MANQVMTAATNLTAIIPEIWSRRYYDVLLAQLPFNSIISKDYEGEIKDLGDTVNISTFPEFSEGDLLAEDAAAEAKAITVSSQQLVINNRVTKDFIITKLATAQSLESMDKLKELAVYAIMKKVQAIIIAATIPSASAPDHIIAYTSGTVMALADILAAKRLIDLQNVAEDGRTLIMGTSQANDLFNITGFMSSDFVTAGSPLSSGQIPMQLLGFAPRMTTVVGNTSYFIHSSYMTMAAQQGMDIKEYDLGINGTRGIRVNLDTLFGLKQLDNKRLVTIS